MANDSLDPYYRWLGIPAAEQPANHYRLLGLTVFESDREVIEAAAMRQMAHVRSYALGPHSELSQVLLSEIADAKLTLLDSPRKRQYDEDLREQTNQASTTKPVACPNCAVNLTFNESSFGTQVRCSQCKAILQISSDGSQCSEVSQVTTTQQPTQASPLDDNFNSALPSFSNIKTQPPSTKRISQTEAGKRKTNYSWILAIAVPMGGISLTVVILWVAFKKDPLAVIVAETHLQENESDPVRSADLDGEQDEAVSIESDIEKPPRFDIRSITNAETSRQQRAVLNFQEQTERDTLDKEADSDTEEVLESVPSEVLNSANSDSNASDVSGQREQSSSGSATLAETMHPLVVAYRKALEEKTSIFRDRLDAIDQKFRADATADKRQLIVYLQEQADTFTRRGDTDQLRNQRKLIDWAETYEPTLIGPVSIDSQPPSSHPRLKRFLDDLEKSKLRFIREIDKQREDFERTHEDLRNETASKLQQEAAAIAVKTSGLEDNESIDTQLERAVHLLEVSKALDLEQPSIDFGFAQQLTNSIGIEFRLIPAGKFMMGSNDGNDDEQPLHEVVLTKDFYIGAFEVTQRQYERVMGVNPSRVKGPQHPVENLSWNDAVEFCRKLSAFPEERSAGRSYRLPTEAEWEYACRAGTQTRYSFGDDATNLDAHAWYERNSGGRTHPVGQKKPNSWGLYDMHGNVWEYCKDIRADYPNTIAIDPSGPTSGSTRVSRGSCAYAEFGKTFRSAQRGSVEPSRRWYNTGVRICCDIIKPARVDTAAPKVQKANAPRLPAGLNPDVWISFDQDINEPFTQVNLGFAADRFGQLGKAVQFADNTVVRTRELDFGNDSDPKTVAIWFKTTEPENDLWMHAGRRYILTRDGGHLWSGLGTDIRTKRYVTDGKWHHALVTRVGKNERLYLDGMPVGQATGPGKYPAPVRGVTGIGSGHADGYAKNRFSNGSIDDFMFFKESLNDQQVLTLYNALSSK